MIKYFCDRCEKAVSADRDFNVVNLKAGTNQEIPRELSICFECFVFVREYLLYPQLSSEEVE